MCYDKRQVNAPWWLRARSLSNKIDSLNVTDTLVKWIVVVIRVLMILAGDLLHAPVSAHTQRHARTYVPVHVSANRKIRPLK